MNANEKRFFYALLAFLAVGLAAWGQEVNFIEADLQPGGTVSELRQQHPECLAVSKDEFYQKCAELGGFENTDAAYRKLRPGKIKLPVAAKPETEPTAVLQPVEKPAEETIEVAPSAPETVDEKEVSAGQVDLANILFGPELTEADLEREALAQESKVLATKLADAEHDVAKMEQTITSLQKQLETAEEKVEVVEIPFPMEVEVARKESLGEMVAEPASITLAGLSLTCLCFVWRSRNQYRQRVKDLERQIINTDKLKAYAATLRKAVEKTHVFIPTGGEPQVLMCHIRGRSKEGRIFVSVPWSEEPVEQDKVLSQLCALPKDKLTELGLTLPIIKKDKTSEEPDKESWTRRFNKKWVEIPKEAKTA